MNEDKEISQLIWDGIVPMVLTLAANEATMELPPAPYYILAPRCSYMPLVATAAQRHFSSSIAIPDCDDELWFEYEGIPLKWHWPVGVLYDLYGSPDNLPWPITVHFQGFPEEDLMHCTSRETVESMLVNSIKEADCLRNASAKRTLELPPKTWKQLWDGICKRRYDSYWEVKKKLLVKDDNQPIKCVPFRIYIKNQPILRAQLQPLFPDGQAKTLRDMMKELLPELFPTTAQDSYGQEPHAQVVVHGVMTPMETPVPWMCDNLIYLDNFLHIVVQLPEDDK